jgi:hypothetical protein
VTESARLRLVEIAAVLVIVVCVAAIAIPKSKDMRRHDAATQVLSDVETVREAVYQFYSDSAYFPVESPGDAIPQSLTRYLPQGFASETFYGAIQYKNWPMRRGSQAAGAGAGSGGGGGPANVIGAIVTTKDPRVAADAAAMAPGVPEFTVGEAYTFIFFGS